MKNDGACSANIYTRRRSGGEKRRRQQRKEGERRGRPLQRQGVSGLRPLAAWVWVGPGRGDEEVEGERDRPSHVWPRPRPDGAVPAACTDPCTAGASAAGDPSTNQTNPAPCMTYTRSAASQASDQRPDGQRWQRVPEIRNLMGFYSIRARVWDNFSTRGSANGQKVRPVGFAGMGLGT